MAPYRCPPGPYERASLVAAYFKRAKPRSKVLVLDANPDITSKAGLFKRAWSDLYPDLIEYRANSRAVGIDGPARVVKLELDDVKGDVLNVVPPQRAGNIARQAGLITTNNRWCDVDWRSMESKAVKGIHLLGDATLSAPAMPKSASMANNQAKIAAAAIVELLNGRNAEPVKIINTCYSFVSPKEAIRVSSVHEWDASQDTLVGVKASGGVSAARSEAEAGYAWSWARSIWADSLA
jgi:NADPH-dependent 2,4-dienoyl-CoA reductase/sulfur reductase-like enzyme